MKHFFTFLIIAVLCSCRQEKKYHDEQMVVVESVQSDKLMDILKFQQKLNAEFKDPDTSPLPDRFRADFETLDFFEADTTFVIEADFIRTPEALPFSMPTTTDRISTEVLYGIAKFNLKGKVYELEVYQTPELIAQEKYKDYLFLPFTDATNGKETYGGGRYLDLRIPKGNKIVLDFNKAYNPYCAYNKKYSCPLVPSVNHLDVAITVGVKAFEH
ncbi:DUF1684 domain-containing protein [Maribacter confluentis]|uniref:DUF1684 domain-containing protein n=1 Tax=Maribacter confluentis TaxID=1656093 RepID=A0ABT8RSW0_9FLAO|nr:DUF1684 domain-containing protein [Maribacter confluentis]MDO1513968.1 DUF1684 domain-containing protein [Maribacter confluentis]